MAVTLSTNVDDRIAQKVRSVADKEHRSVSNVVSSAITVFTGLPKDLRDALLELQSQDAEAFKRLSREMMAALSRLRFEASTEKLLADLDYTSVGDGNDLDLLEEATRLARAARPTASP